MTDPIVLGVVPQGNYLIHLPASGKTYTLKSKRGERSTTASEPSAASMERKATPGSLTVKMRMETADFGTAMIPTDAPADPPPKIEVTALSARGLAKTTSATGGVANPNPFCVLKLNGHEFARTTAAKHTLTPHWGAASETDDPLETVLAVDKLDGVLCVEVWDKEMIGGPVFLGEVLIRGEVLTATPVGVLEYQLRCKLDMPREAQKQVQGFVSLRVTLRSQDAGDMLPIDETQTQISVDPATINVISVCQRTEGGEREVGNQRVCA